MSLSLSSRFDGSACVACDVLGAMCSVCAPVDAARVRAAREMSVPVVGSPVFGDAATDALVARLGCSAPVPSYALPADVVSALREAEGRLSGDEQFYALRCSEACDADGGCRGCDGSSEPWELPCVACGMPFCLGGREACPSGPAGSGSDLW
jgi:hypothetical protein